MAKQSTNHTWKYVFVGLTIFFLGFFIHKVIVHKKMLAGKSGTYSHWKLGDKEARTSQLMKKEDYEQRLKAVEEKVGLLEEQLAE